MSLSSKNIETLPNFQKKLGLWLDKDFMYLLLVSF